MTALAMPDNFSRQEQMGLRLPQLNSGVADADPAADDRERDACQQQVRHVRRDMPLNAGLRARREKRVSWTRVGTCQ